MLEKSTYYILDAQGNQLSIYEHSVDSATNTAYYYLTDRNIYGSSRLGVTKDTINMFNPYTLQSYGVVGNRSYELTDHRGNVQTVINDIKYPLSSDNTTIDSYEVGINSIADYSPFGVQLDGRTIDNVFYYPENGNSPQTPADTVEIYNNDFDNPPATGSPYYSTEVTLDANLSNTKWTSSTGTFTIYNSSGAGSGKSTAISSASADTAYLTLSFDVENGYELDITSYSFAHRSSSTGYDSYKLVVNGIEIGTGSIYVASSGSTLQSTGVVNVSNVVSGVTGTVNVVLKLYGGLHGSTGTFRMDDFILNGYTQEENTGNGSGNGYVVMGGYRYGFGGHEKVDEVKGTGNHYTASYWEMDPRLAKRWNPDPVVKHHESPYAVLANNPIWFVDPSGADTSFYDDKGNYDQQAKEDFMMAYNTVKNKISELENTINEKNEILNSEGIKKREVNNLKKDIKKTQGVLDDWKKLEQDFDNIITSETMFVYSSDASHIPEGFDGIIGSNKDVFNTQTGQWDKIHIFVRSGKDHFVIHENRHANQRLQKVDWSQLKRELDAYQYQRIYNWNSVQEFIDSQTIEKYGHIQENIRPALNLEGAIKFYYEIK